jgi:hypothetical protein
MAAFYDCMAAVATAIGRRITLDEFDALYTRLLEEKDGLFAKGYPSDWLSAARVVAQQIEIEKAIAQRQVIRNRLVFGEAKGFIAAARAAGVDAGRALEARLVGINAPIAGGRKSIAAEAHGLWTTSAGALLADLRRAAGGSDRLVQLFSTPAFEIEIARALRGEKAHPDAVAIGAAVERMREDLRRQENDAGGWRGRLDGYVTRQSHDSLRVRRAGFERWKADILPLLDQERTFDRQQELLAQLRHERGQVLQQRLAAGAEMKTLQGQLEAIGKMEKKAEGRGRRHDRDLADARTDFAHLVGRYLAAAEGTPEQGWLRTELERLRGRMQTLAIKAGDVRRGLPGLVDQWNDTMALVDRVASAANLFDDLGAKMLDYETRLKGAVDPDAFLQRIYNTIAADTHLRGASQEFTGLMSAIGPANIARKRAAHRELHFNSADAEVSYMRKYGAGGVSDSIVREIEGAASAIAVMRGLGTNPEAMFQLLKTELLHEAKETGNHALAKVVNRKTLDWQLAEVLGTTRGVGNPTLAAWSASIRTVQSMAKLGGAMLSSFGDVATAAAELRYQGRGMLSSYADMLEGMFKGRRSGERRIIADLLGVGFESLTGQVLARLGGEAAPPGGLAKASALFFRLNGLSWWTDTHKTTAGLVIARYFAALQEQAFADLPKPTQRLLGQFGMTADHWDLLRRAGVNAAEDGTKFLTPEGVKGIALDDFMTAGERATIDAMTAVKDAAELQKLIDTLPSVRQLAERRDRLASAYATLVTDRVDHAMVTAGARERALVNMGTERGDPLGESLRFVMQFKSFGIAMVQRSLGKEIYGGGSKLSATMRIMFLAAQLAGFGYLTMATKDLLQGKNPRDPLALDTVVAALAQGGGMGILGDFAFGEFNRFGRSALATAAGPTFGTADDLLELWAKARDTDKMARGRYGADFAASSLRTAISNTPFASLFWARPAINYLALYPIQESLNPGYLRRMEDRIKRENRQTFWLSPQEASR